MSLTEIYNFTEKQKVELNSTVDKIFSNLKENSELTKTDIAEILINYMNKGIEANQLINGK